MQYGFLQQSFVFTCSYPKANEIHQRSQIQSVATSLPRANRIIARCFLLGYVTTLNCLTHNYQVTQQTFVLMKTSFVFVFRRRLQDVLRRLDQDEYFRLSLTSLEDVFKTKSRSRPIYSSWPYVFKTSSRPFEDVFKSCSKRLQNLFKASSRCLQDVFKTPSRPLQGVFKTSSRHLQEVLQRYLQDVFKACHQVNLF